ncbi:hypothetical protein ID866_9007 [Astraeus odoratus]|nr:hypothetical protein ID866_9007 [Astraeus odoratus]
MPLVTTLIDDKSPLISYDNTWLPGTGEDAWIDEYFLGTLTFSNVTNSKAIFSFNGTAFWIYGAKRSSHGPFTVQVDDTTYSNNNGYSTDNQIMVPIFSSGTLSQGTHTVALINTATTASQLYLDVDLVVGNSDDELISETVQDTDPRFEYDNLGWSASPLDDNFFSNGTVTRKQAKLPQLSHSRRAHLLLSGEAVTLFGSTGPSYGQYSVQLDAGNTTEYNATTSLPFYGVALFHANNLGGGQHQLRITNIASGGGSGLALDYAAILSLASACVSTASPPMGVGAITGIAISVTIAVLSIATALFYRRKMKAAEEAYEQICSVHMAQQSDGPTTFSSRLEDGTAMGRMQDIPFQSSGYSSNGGLFSAPVGSTASGVSVAEQPFDQHQVIASLFLPPLPLTTIDRVSLRNVTERHRGDYLFPLSLLAR